MFKRIILVTVLLPLTLGCQNFLEEQPVDRFVSSNFYESEKDAQAGVDGVYAKLYDIYKRNMLLLTDLPADDHKNGLGMPNQYLVNLEFLRFTSENTFIRDNWRNHYSGIQRANNVILAINNMELEANIKNRLTAEAIFLRALYYFNLVRFHGDVPLSLGIKSVEDALIPRSPASEVYAQIEADLAFSEANLPKQYNGSEQGRATSGAAKILLGKVLLTEKRFQEAADKLEEVVLQEDSYGYGLHNDFAENWNVETENGKESVFGIELMAPPGVSNSQMGLQGPKFSVPGGRVPGIVGANEADIPTMDLYNSFDEKDLRKAVTFKKIFKSPTTGGLVESVIPLFGKYWKEGETIVNNCDINMQVIRYSDALLMYAEALNEIGKTTEALTYLNRVRARAFGNTDYNYTQQDQTQIRSQIYLERRLELANEGHRWFDLARTGTFLETMRKHGTLEASMAENNKTDITANAKATQVLFPIPQVERDINSLLTQNEGY